MTGHFGIEPRKMNINGGSIYNIATKQLLEPVFSLDDYQDTLSRIANRTSVLTFCPSSYGAYFGGRPMRADRMSSKNKANTVINKNLPFECPYRWAFQGSRKVFINGGSIFSSINARLLAGTAFAVMLGCCWTSTAIALEPTVFPGKGSRAVWNKAAKIVNEGLDLANANQFDAAIPKFLQAIVIYPHSDCFYLNLGVSYESKKKPELLKAEAAYRNATRLDPKDWRNWNALAGNLGDQKRYLECREAAARALTCHPPVADSKKLQSNIAELDKVLLR